MTEQVKEKLFTLASNYGAKRLTYLGKFGKEDVYVTELLTTAQEKEAEKNGTVVCVGTPTFLIVNGNNVKAIPYYSDEADKYIDEFYSDED